jgi:hypothetical protein
MDTMRTVRPSDAVEAIGHRRHLKMEAADYQPPIVTGSWALDAKRRVAAHAARVRAELGQLEPDFAARRVTGQRHGATVWPFLLQILRRGGWHLTRSLAATARVGVNQAATALHRQRLLGRVERRRGLDSKWEYRLRH